MSSAFMRERDNQWLHEIPPTINALILYLTQENNGIGVFEKRSFNDPELNKQVRVMSNGLSYFINDKGQWDVI